jgi:hypothetical protein
MVFHVVEAGTHLVSWLLNVASVTVQENQPTLSGDRISGAAHFTSFFPFKW